MPRFQREHILLPINPESLSYTSPNTGRSKVIPRTIGSRQGHGTAVRQKFNEAVNTSRAELVTDNVYVVFKSPLDFLLDIDKLDKGNFRLASYKAIWTNDRRGQPHVHYEATVAVNRRGVSQFLAKVEQYLNEDTKGGNPRNLSLIANIEEITSATLQSFWQEPEVSFPATDQDNWWEIWFSRNNNDDDTNPLDTVLPLLNAHQVRVSERILKFPEHWVVLIKCTALQLQPLLRSDRLAEIRKPRETADFFTTLEHVEQNAWVNDLRARVDNLSHENNVSICLLDTGVNRGHPLLEPLIPERHIDVVNPAWATADNQRPYGHGTPMAGLALFGDLTDKMSSTERVQIFHHLESIKFINDAAPHDPELYGAVTQEAIARGEIINPNFKRIVCMAVTCADTIHRGRPTSWSAAVDQSMFGDIEGPNDNILVVISAGNLPFDARVNYPLENRDHTIQDPAQSYNALTVGAYTLKDQIDIHLFPGAELLAQRGAMSPCSTTSIGWIHEWCKKPDIVMEGGNNAIQDGNTIDPESLLLLSTSRGGVGRSLITSFNDTSAATALASKFAAELYTQYPTLKPETIRALIVHSADWTPAMLNNRQISALSSPEKELLLAHVGYGVPHLGRARYSLNNSLSMILERTLTPFRLDGSTIKTNEFHLYELPWPTDVLQELLATTVRFKITLSYFIEPNPGNRQYELSASYKSHGLRFKMINPNETLDAFKGRISRTFREEGYVSEGSDQWVLGSQLRDKGSIHKDIWEGTAADLATRNKIAIYPVGGWWKTRKRLGRYANSVNYSLVMTIDTPDLDTDIYTPVAVQIPIEI